MATHSDVEDELLAEQQRQFEQQQQQERIAAMQQAEEERQNSPVNQAADYAKKAVKGMVKDAAVEAAGSAIAASAPVWGPILGILVVVMLVMGAGFFVIGTMVSYCNAGGASGFMASTGSKLASIAGIIPDDVCSQLAVKPGGSSGGAGGGATFTGIDIIITSAYRPGAIVAGTSRLSAHGRGEAVDIALRNPTVPIRGTDPRIAQLVQIARSAGFNPAAGDTLDEYTNPTEGASGGHIHVEFNLKSDGRTTYCDNTVSNNPPTDLVDIPASIPRSGVSNAKLRPCMLSALQAILSAAASVPAPNPTPAP
jgi:hypothetical protein